MDASKLTIFKNQRHCQIHNDIREWSLYDMVALKHILRFDSLINNKQCHQTYSSEENEHFDVFLERVRPLAKAAFLKIESNDSH